MNPCQGKEGPLGPPVTLPFALHFTLDVGSVTANGIIKKDGFISADPIQMNFTWYRQWREVLAYFAKLTEE